MARALDPFDQSIFRCGIDHKAFADFLDGLMVGGIDLQGLCLDDATQAGAGMNLYGMPAFVLFCALFVFAGVWKLGRDILVKRTA